MAIGIVCTTAAASAATCESIATLSLPNSKVTVAQQVAPGTFTPWSDGLARACLRQASRVLSRCCDAHASSDSDVKIEVWLGNRLEREVPGRRRGLGVGRHVPILRWPTPSSEVTRPLEVPDTGHVGGTAAFALSHPKRWSTSAIGPCMR